MENNELLVTQINEVMRMNPAVHTALELVSQMKYKEASDLLIQHQRELLPDGHPSKGAREPSKLEGEDVSKIYKFENLSGIIEDTMKFFSLIVKLHGDGEFAVGCIAEYFLYLRPHDMGNFANFAVQYEELRQAENPVYPWRPTKNSDGD